MKKLQMLLCAFAACTAMAELVEYRDYDANTGTFTNAVRECTLVTSETRTLENGWYAVEGAVTIPADANLTVNGTAHLILCDGAKLTILNPGDHRNAVYVSKAASLIIYGQTAGTGALTVTGGNFSAGIGGGCCGAGGGVGGDSGSVSGDNHANEMPVSLCGTNGLDVATEENGSETDLFLSLDGIDGESKNPRHDLWIDLLNIYHGDASLEGTDIPEYFSRGVTESIVIKHLVDKATPKIQELYMNGGSIDWGCVEYTRTVAGGQAFSYRVEFEGLQVVSAVVESEELPDGAFQLVETVKFLVNRQTWQAEDLPREVTIGNHPHLSAAYTSGRGTVTNAIDGTSFTVPVGTKHVKVIFTPDPGLEILGDAAVEIGTVTKNIVFGGGSGYRVPDVAYPYLDYDAVSGTMTNAVASVERCTVVTAATRMLTSGWYVVTNAVAIPAGANLTVNGDAHLILCDGASLTVADPGDHAAGIAVVDANRLTIYGQEAGTGVLTAQGGEYSAGIGGFADGRSDVEPDCGTVTVCGGTVVATGRNGAAGIGCSPMGIGGHVAIHGGTVTAVGSMGIGCGYDAYYFLLPEPNSDVVITGGKVTAKATSDGEDICWAKISVSGGVFARRPKDEWCAVGYSVLPNTDPATCGDYPYAVSHSCTVTIGVCPEHVSAAWTSGEGTVTNAIVGASFAVPQGADAVRVIFTAEPEWELVDGEAEVVLGTVTDDIVFGAGNDYRVPTARYLLGDIPYLDWDGTQMTNAALPKYVFTFVTDRTRELTDGWYAVTNDVVFPVDANLEVHGTAHLVLCDGALLTITNSGMNSAAVAVPTGASLTIYGQEAGTGELVAMGGSGVAGIGGTVTINGGSVTARGGDMGAGIGGGQGGAGGVVTINGGTVTARGGDMGAGIGGGQGGAGGRVTIRGGAVSATGGSGAEDVGRGAGLQDSGAVSVSGGIFARPVQNAWLAADCAVIANQDAVTAAEYPWAVVPYPAAWPEADAAVKAKFGDWHKGVGASADLSTDDAQKAFLLNVPVTGIKELKIESIDVDAEGYATIVVRAPGMFGFNIDLGDINGVLYVHAGDTLETMTPKAVAYWTTTSGKAVIKVKENFIRAAIGFKTPDVAADTLPLEQGVAK